MEKWATGIFTSIHGGLGAGLGAVRGLGVSTVHLHAPSVEYRTPARTAEIKAQFGEAGVTITVLYVAFPDDDYSTVERVVQSVGLVPRDRRRARLKETLELADMAAALGVDAIGMHLGFVPHDASSRDFGDVVATARAVCDHCAGNGQRFHLETGQETAAELL
ncbi:MAG: TIM barrel protein, partial [Gemmatimonadota bacterium]